MVNSVGKSQIVQPKASISPAPMMNPISTPTPNPSLLFLLHSQGLLMLCLSVVRARSL